MKTILKLLIGVLFDRLGPPDFHLQTPTCPEETLTRDYVQNGFKETVEGLEVSVCHHLFRLLWLKYLVHVCIAIFLFSSIELIISVGMSSLLFPGSQRDFIITDSSFYEASNP